MAVNDEPRLKGRVANAAAPMRMDKLAQIPEEYGTPQKALRRHKNGNNILFMDQHGEPMNQEDSFSKLLYSWTEPVQPEAPPRS